MTAFTEVGPDAQLTAQAVTGLADTGGELLFAAIARRGTAEPEPRTLFDALGRLHVHGVPVDWRRVYADKGARRATCRPTLSSGSATGCPTPPPRPGPAPLPATRC